jgi:predicted lipoprotein
MTGDNIQNNQNISNKELLDFLIKRFDANDKRFDAIDQRFDGVDKKFAIFQNQYIADFKSLADLMASQFEKVYEKLDQKADKADMEKMLATKADKSDIDAVLTRVAQLGSKIDDYRAEEIGLKRQVKKHEKWHFQTAAKVGIKLLAE